MHGVTPARAREPEGRCGHARAYPARFSADSLAAPRLHARVCTFPGGPAGGDFLLQSPWSHCAHAQACTCADVHAWVRWGFPLAPEPGPTRCVYQTCCTRALNHTGGRWRTQGSAHLSGPEEIIKETSTAPVLWSREVLEARALPFTAVSLHS